MTFQFLSQIILFLLALSCVIWSGFITTMIIGEINRKLPEKDQISYLWGHYAKARRIKYEYRRLYPNGRLWLYQGILTYTAFGLLVLLALGWRFGIFK